MDDVFVVRLNEKGQCPECLVKPLIYKRDRRKFCDRCDRSFDIESGIHVDNWAWRDGIRIRGGPPQSSPE